MSDRDRFHPYGETAEFRTNLRRVRKAFSATALARVCAMHEDEFASAYEFKTYKVDQPAPSDVFHYREGGDNILAVAHLDTVGLPDERRARFINTEAGKVVFSRALDDRLGAYILLHLLPALGINHNVLLTTGEEQCQSTAAFFSPARSYDWMIEFDRGGTDVVMYQYETEWLVDAVQDTGARVAEGIFTDICVLDHLGVRGLNWGVGYRDYHGPRAHAYLEDTFEMVARYLSFHAEWDGEAMPYEAPPAYSSLGYGSGLYSWDQD